MTDAGRPDALKRPLRLLVVDDHEVVRQGLVALLDRRENFQVVAEAGSVAPAPPADNPATHINIPVAIRIEAHLPPPKRIILLCHGRRIPGGRAHTIGGVEPCKKSTDGTMGVRRNLRWMY